MNLKKMFSDHSGVGHLKGMAVIVGGVFVVLVVMGKPAGDAILFALFLACPLMMVGMMFGGHQGHQGHDSGERTAETSAAAKSVPPHVSARPDRTTTSHERQECASFSADRDDDLVVLGDVRHATR